MKNLTFILLFIVTLATAQKIDEYDYVYGSFTFDLNNAFGIIENPRTVEQTNGFDFDAEIGARWNHFGVYLFYGTFQEINYLNYGAGVDYYFHWFRKIDMSIGIGNGMVLRKYYSHNNEPAWGSHMAPHIRAITTVWITKNVGVVFRAQLQNRPDIDKTAIFEGHLGIILSGQMKPIRK